MAAVKLHVYKLFEKTYGEENAKVIMTFIEENNQKQINDLRSIYLTKDDKIDLIDKINGVHENLNGFKVDIIQRLDSHFRWLVGIMLTVAGLGIALAKLL